MKKYIRNLAYLAVFAAYFSASAGSFDDFFRYARSDNASGIAELLNRGFDPNTRDEQGQTGLLIALREPSPKVIQVLLDSPKTDVELRNAKDESPLMLAALKGQQDLVTRLIARDADVNKPGWTPLHYAATGGHVAIMKQLLEHYAFIDAQSPNGSTPLMMAARYGNEEAVDALLAAGADRALKNDLGMDASAFAASAGRDRLAARLKPGVAAK